VASPSKAQRPVAVSEREWEQVLTVLDRHDDRLRALELRQAEARGAARAAAKGASRLVGAVGIVGMIGQLIISGFHF
jgi:hypothetical protein